MQMPLIKDTSHVIFYRIVLGMILLATDVVLGRALGPTLKGYYYIMYITPILLATVATLGLDYSLNYHGHKSPESTISMFRTALILGECASIILCVVLFLDIGGLRSFVYRGIPDSFQKEIIISIVILPVEVFTLLSAMLVITLGQPVVYAKMRIVRSLVILIGVFFVLHLILRGLAKYYISGLLILQIAAAMMGLLYCLRAVGFEWGKKKFRIYPLLRTSVGAFPARVSERYQSRIGAILLGLLGSGFEVGIFSVGLAISEILFFISGSISSVLFSRNLRKNREIHIIVFRLMIPLSIFLAIIAAGVSSLAIPLLYGPLFYKSVIILWLLTPGVVSASIMHTILPYMVQKGFSYIISIAQLIAITANVAISVILIRSYQSIGVAIASSFSYSLTIITLLSWLAILEHKTLFELVIVKRSDINMLIAVIKKIMKKDTFMPSK